MDLYLILQCFFVMKCGLWYIVIWSIFWYIKPSNRPKAFCSLFFAAQYHSQQLVPLSGHWYDIFVGIALSHREISIPSQWWWVAVSEYCYLIFEKLIYSFVKKSIPCFTRTNCNLQSAGSLAAGNCNAAVRIYNLAAET